MGNMENIRPKGVKIMLDRERHMRLTFSGIEYLTEKYGDLNKAFGVLGELSQAAAMAKPEISGKMISAIVDFTYACLMADDRQLTREMVADMLDIGSIGEVARCIALSVNGSMPEAAETSGPQ
jgi:hypothetical protein